MGSLSAMEFSNEKVMSLIFPPLSRLIPDGRYGLRIDAKFLPFFRPMLLSMNLLFKLPYFSLLFKVVFVCNIMGCMNISVSEDKSLTYGLYF